MMFHVDCAQLNNSFLPKCADGKRRVRANTGEQSVTLQILIQAQLDTTRIK